MLKNSNDSQKSLIFLSQDKRITHLVPKDFVLFQCLSSIFISFPPFPHHCFRPAYLQLHATKDSICDTKWRILEESTKLTIEHRRPIFSFPHYYFDGSIFWWKWKSWCLQLNNKMYSVKYFLPWLTFWRRRQSCSWNKFWLLIKNSARTIKN